MKILAIDLGKFNSVACIYDEKITKNRFQKFNTAPAVLHDLLVIEEPDLLLIEVCSIAGWVCDMAETLNIEIKVANTNEDKFKWKNTKRKTDKDDALRLIEMHIVNRFSTVHIPKTKTRQRRAMIKGRKAISGRITSIKNNIRAILDRQGLVMGKGKSGWTKRSIVYLRSLAVEPQKSTEDNLWRSMLCIELNLLVVLQKALAQAEEVLDKISDNDKATQIIKTTPGIGYRTAEIVAATIDDPGRFKNGKQAGCYVGFTPRLYESGAIRREGGISHKGNAMLRGILVEACWLGMRYNPWIRETYEKICRGDKNRRKIAIVAVARKLFVRLWAMMRDNQPWRGKLLHG